MSAKCFPTSVRHRSHQRYSNLLQCFTNLFKPVLCSLKILPRLELSNNDKIFSGPEFSHYLYFLFAPTLIYRDEYPRNSRIDWTFVLGMFGQVFAAIIYVYYVVIRFCVPIFIHLNQKEITLSTFVSVLFNSIMPGSLFLLLSKRNATVRALSTDRVCSLLRFASLLVECLCWNVTICWSDVLSSRRERPIEIYHSKAFGTF